jgi:hypothetical protein
LGNDDRRKTQAHQRKHTELNALVEAAPGWPRRFSDGGDAGWRESAFGETHDCPDQQKAREATSYAGETREQR